MAAYAGKVGLTFPVLSATRGRPPRLAPGTRFVAWLQKCHDWPGLKAVVMVESTRETAGKIERETRFYITSLVLLAHLLGPIVRSHWAIENSLHWVMDMIFRDGECRVRTDHAPANFATIKHMAHNLIRTAPGKASLRLKRKTAGWDDDFLAQLITRQASSPDSPGAWRCSSLAVAGDLPAISNTCESVPTGNRTTYPLVNLAEPA